MNDKLVFWFVVISSVYWGVNAVFATNTASKCNTLGQIVFVIAMVAGMITMALLGFVIAFHS